MKAKFSVNFPPVEVHFQLQSGPYKASTSSKGFGNVKSARKWLRHQHLSIKDAEVTTRTEPAPYPPTTLITFTTIIPAIS